MFGRVTVTAIVNTTASARQTPSAISAMRFNGQRGRTNRRPASGTGPGGESEVATHLMLTGSEAETHRVIPPRARELLPCFVKIRPQAAGHAELLAGMWIAG
jgi:hypothetical protein